MSSTVQTVLAKFARKFPECPSAVQQQLFYDAHRKLCTRVQVRNMTVTVTLTSGVREYALDPNAFEIHSAYYQSASTSWFPLIERSTDELDVLYPSWRSIQQSGQPYEYYITSITDGDTAKPAIGFVQIPSVSTSGSYPVVTLFTTLWADISGSETVPSQMLTDNYYVWEMYSKWCAEIEDWERCAQWEVMAEKQLDIEHNHIQNTQSKGMEGFFPTSAYMPTRGI